MPFVTLTYPGTKRDRAIKCEWKSVIFNITVAVNTKMQSSN